MNVVLLVLTPLIEHSRFTNRELSWLKFNFRVLEEGRRKKNPLLERLKFLSIVASNLDEFFEIRVAGLEQQLAAENQSVDNSGLTPEKILNRVYRGTNYLVKLLYFTWNYEILPGLAKEEIFILSYSQLSFEQKKYLNQLYYEEIYPVLTPIKIDSAHPFPWIINKALCIAVVFESSVPNKIELGVVTVPRILPRIIKIPSIKGKPSAFILISEIIQENLDGLFKGYNIRFKTSFRVTRNSNLYLNEEEASDLLEAIKAELHNRKKGDAVRLEIRKNATPELIEQLCIIFNLKKNHVYFSDGPVNFNRLMSLYEMLDRVDLKYKTFYPYQLKWLREKENIFQKIKEKDILLHHPYQSFQPIIYFLEKAAHDKDVLAIKMTLYRTATDSPLIHALIDAAQNNKEVTVVVELKASFDEASNVAWAKYLLDNGVHVVYGLLRLKTHCKLLLIIRKEAKKIVKYVHIGTGNYNPKTASMYTDMSLFTSHLEIIKDVVEVFNFLTSLSKKPNFKRLLVAPNFMLNKFLRMIDREIKATKEGKKGLIIFKVNALQETSIINALYKASEAGVQIYGIVRGICCLKPGRKGYSENIYIKSIIGRFLEHTRIYYFANSKPNLYIGSADWMPRNLHHRIEIATPILDKNIHNRIIHEILEFQLQDNVDARVINAKTKEGMSSTLFSSQKTFISLSQGKKITLPRNQVSLLNLPT